MCARTKGRNVNEELIEEAAMKIDSDAWLRADDYRALFDRPFGSTEQRDRKEAAREKARAAFVVFEKAHTPTDERTPIAELDARQAGYRKDREDWYVDHDAEPEITTNAWFRGWDEAASYFRRTVQGEPTDDEREALAFVIERGWGNPTWDGKTLRPLDRQIADAILAAGFRRTIQGEPTVTVATKPAIDAARRVVESMEDWQVEPDAALEILSALDDIPDCESWSAVPHSEHVQGEPTDAMVEAAARSLAVHDGIRGDVVPEWADSYKGIARDTLRAALSVSEQGNTDG